MQRNDEIGEFEQRLKGQPMRQAPAEWREEILSAASEAQASHHSQSDAGQSLLSILNRRLASLLWPHPVAWAGLAAVWIFIFALNFSIRDEVPVMAKKASPLSPAMVAELRQQQRLYAELMGADELRDADRQKVFVHGPRSESTEILTA